MSLLAGAGRGHIVPPVLATGAAKRALPLVHSGAARSLIARRQRCDYITIITFICAITICVHCPYVDWVNPVYYAILHSGAARSLILRWQRCDHITIVTPSRLICISVPWPCAECRVLFARAPVFALCFCVSVTTTCVSHMP